MVGVGRRRSKYASRARQRHAIAATRPRRVADAIKSQLISDITLDARRGTPARQAGMRRRRRRRRLDEQRMPHTDSHTHHR